MRKLETNRIYNKDCIVGMQEMDENSVDLIIADPPYNLSKSKKLSYNTEDRLSGMGGNWIITDERWDDMPLSDYMSFTEKWLSEAKRILKPTGSMWIFGTYHNIGIVNILCQKFEIEIINEVVWFKRNAFPNLSGRCLTASHETILWCHSGGSRHRKYFFDYEYSKSGDFSYDGLKAEGKQMRTVWDIPNNKKSEELQYGKHPTQKPLRVLDRMIRLSSRENDIVFTPFAGAGSECVAAKMAGRRYLGFELEEDYCRIAEKRLSHVQEDKILKFDIIDENIESSSDAFDDLTAENVKDFDLAVKNYKHGIVYPLKMED